MNNRGGDWTWHYFVASGWNWFNCLRSKQAQRIAAAAVAGSLFVLAIVLDFHTSWFESLVFRAAGRHISYHLAEGPSHNIQYPGAGPYDWTLGYARLPDFLPRVEAAGYRVDAQARNSRMYSLIARSGLYPIYAQKDVAGLTIADRDGNSLFSFRRPERVYQNYSEIPPLVVRSLLFIENRQMLDSKRPRRNPALEWGRLMKAMLDYGLHTVNPSHHVSGGSTLATQLQKMRHSPGGRTRSAREKLRQITSATLAAYQNGGETLEAQREIVRAYINSIPLAASPSYGEVTGLGDGLWAWYGVDISKINRVLVTREESLGKTEMRMRARHYRQVLSLLLALRSPSYLKEHPVALDALTDRYLGALAARGIISHRLRDLALKERVRPLPQFPPQRPASFVANKAPNAVRMSLLSLLGVDNAYDLDRLDLTVHTTIDQRAQQNITQFLEQITARKGVAAAGLAQYQLLESSDPRNVVYSFTLYEKGAGANLLRVETDNLNQPLNINQGTRLELGSTAKLRTLINYLEIVADLHKEYSTRSAAQLQAVRIFPDDHLTEWAVKYLATSQNRSLTSMLEAALERKYTSSTGESFFTGGGVHHFANFERDETGGLVTVSTALHKSVNLVFIRVMRDVVNYYRYRVPGASPALLEDPNDLSRQKYLERFADQEGRLFLSRFYEKYQGVDPVDSLERLMRGLHLTTTRAAVIHRSLRPQAGIAEFAAFMKGHLPREAMAKVDPAVLYDKYGPGKFNVADRGYLAHVHPLELWLLEYRSQHPGAARAEIIAQSAKVRRDVYWWLFRTKYKRAQDNRIRTLLEQDAFKEIYRAWKRQGYPFDSLVPSYATTIGVSGDTPAALADLMGILVNGGIRYPTIKIDQLHFGPGTPTETIAGRELPKGQRVIAPEIARLVRKELIGVVENGTAHRAHGAIVLSNGWTVPVGGKTGTGDNRRESSSASGHLIGSKVVSRTAAFVFDIGDRFYGAIIAYVPGQQASGYRFTSALAVQIFKDLAPQLKYLLERHENGMPPSTLLAATSSTSRAKP